MDLGPQAGLMDVRHVGRGEGPVVDADIVDQAAEADARARGVGELAAR